MLDEIGAKENVESWLDKTLARHGKVMGMGHRVYKAKNPRAVTMEQMLLDLAKQKSDMHLYELLKQLEQSFRDRMEEKGKPIYPNVDSFRARSTHCWAFPATCLRRCSQRPGRRAGTYPRTA